MFLLTTFRTFKFAWQNFCRNIWLSIATIVILVLTLFSISLVISVNLVGDRAIQSVKDKIDAAVYFYSTVEESKVLTIRADLLKLDEVKDVRYISKDEALADFKERNKDNPVIQETLQTLTENPLGPTLVIKAKRLEDYQAILSNLSGYNDLIQNKDFEDNQLIIDRLSQISRRTSQVGLVVSGVFVIIALLIISNAIRVTIYTHREEINIMKLVGASNWFVRAPFLVESILYAILATIITILILYPLLTFVAPYLNNFLAGYNLNILTYFNQYFLEIFGLQLLVALVISILSSAVAISRYLKV